VIILEGYVEYGALLNCETAIDPSYTIVFVTHRYQKVKQLYAFDPTTGAFQQLSAHSAVGTTDIEYQRVWTHAMFSS